MASSAFPKPPVRIWSVSSTWSRAFRSGHGRAACTWAATLSRDARRRPDRSTLALVEGLEGVPDVLAIGTIEPRKDYATVLAAYEKLWSRDRLARSSS